MIQAEILSVQKKPWDRKVRAGTRDRWLWEVLYCHLLEIWDCFHVEWNVLVYEEAGRRPVLLLAGQQVETGSFSKVFNVWANNWILLTCISFYRGRRYGSTLGTNWFKEAWALKKVPVTGNSWRKKVHNANICILLIPETSRKQEYFGEFV